MKMLLRKRAVRAIGPRLNQWKGARASQVSDQRQQARRERLCLAGTTCAARGAMDRRSCGVGLGADYGHARDGAGSSGLAGNPRGRG